MRTIRASIKTVLLVLTAMSFTAALARADTYSSTNLQSDLPGVAAHVDPNLVNPWGMAANSTGSVIWVSDNGTGVSTLYQQDGTPAPTAANPLVVTIPTSARNKGHGNPTVSKSRSMEIPCLPYSSSSAKTGPSLDGTRTSIRRTPSSPSITARTWEATAPFIKVQR